MAALSRRCVEGEEKIEKVRLRFANFVFGEQPTFACSGRARDPYRGVPPPSVVLPAKDSKAPVRAPGRRLTSETQLARRQVGPSQHVTYFCRYLVEAKFHPYIAAPPNTNKRQRSLELQVELHMPTACMLPTF